jgi:hypothetical protein
MRWAWEEFARQAPVIFSSTTITAEQRGSKRAGEFPPAVWKLGKRDGWNHGPLKLHHTGSVALPNHPPICGSDKTRDRRLADSHETPAIPLSRAHGTRRASRCCTAVFIRKGGRWG